MLEGTVFFPVLLLKMILLSWTDLSFLCWSITDNYIPNQSYMGHKVCQEVALRVFSNHSRVFSWPSYFSKTDDCFSYLEHCFLKGLVWWLIQGLENLWSLPLILLNLDAILPSCVLKKKVRFLNLKSSFSNRPWKRKPLFAHKAFPSRMNLTWYKPKVWNSSTGGQYFLSDGI